MKIFFIFSLLLLSTNIAAIELVLIKSISDSKQTFVSTGGKDKGIIEGTEGVFATDNASIIAVAELVTRDYTKWRLKNENAATPFHREELVSFSKATENIWTLTSEEQLARLKIYQIDKRISSNSLIARVNMFKGLDQSTSNAPTSTVTRNGTQLELSYEKPIGQVFAWSLGGRLEMENIEVNGTVFNSTKYIGLLALTAYLPRFEGMVQNQLYISGVVGYGWNATVWESYSETGSVTLLPEVKMGINIPLNDQFDLMTELGIEAVSLNNKSDDGYSQTTNQTNLKAGIGLRILI